MVAEAQQSCFSFISLVSLQVAYFGDSIRSDMFPARTFADWETVMIVEEMEGEGVPKSEATMANEAQAEPLEKRGKFEVSSRRQLFLFSCPTSNQPSSPRARPAANTCPEFW